MILVYRYRVKSLTDLLNRQARAVNFVWNYCNDRQKDALRYNRRWLSGFDLNNLTAGSSKELSLHSGTINAVCEQYAKSRSAKKRPYLRYRGKKSLGWVPLKGRDLKRENDAFRFAGNTFRVFNSRSIPDNAKIKDGCSFSCDACGHWFLNVVLDLPNVVGTARAEVGIDLGLKRFATLSTGEQIDAPREYRKLEEKLGKAQRSNKKRLVRHIHRKIADSRKDFQHKLSTRIVREFGMVAVGNVSAAGLAKTSMAKSVLDAGWSSFRAMLNYKAIARQQIFLEVNESFTTQVCSECGALSATRPKGIAGLRIREWTCSDCGYLHDRDVNAAKNILRLGHQSLAVGIPVL